MDMTIYKLIEYNCSRFAGKTALVYGRKRISYAELGRRVNMVASNFRKSGISKGDYVGVLVHNSDDFCVSFLALQKLGAIAVLLNWRHNLEEAVGLIALTDCSKLIYSDSFEEFVDEVRKRSTRVSLFTRLSTIKEPGFVQEIEIGGDPDFAFEADTNSSDGALVFFTSGSTGLSKAAEHTVGSLLNWVFLQHLSEWRVRSRDVSLCYSPLFHLGGFQVMLHTLTAGGTLVIMDCFDARKILELSEKEKVTQITLIPPSIVNEVARAAKDCDFDVQSVNLVLLEGGENSRNCIEATYATFPCASFMHALGHSENAMTCTMTMSREEYARNPDRACSVGPCVAYSRLKLVDESGAEVPDGTPGFAMAKSPAMMKGYVGRDSFSDGWLDTGDVLRRDADGYYYFMGRRSSMIKTGGENVYPSEVEAALMENPAISRCIVFGAPHDYYGEMVVAAVILAPGHEATEQEIIQDCKRRISSYKKPRRVLFFEEFPLTALGKIKREEMIEEAVNLISHKH